MASGTVVVQGDIIRVVTYTRLDGQQGLNVRHLRCQSTGGPDVTHGDLADSLDSILAPLYKAYLPNDVTYEGVGVREVNQAPTIETLSFARQGPGDVAGNPLPKNAAPVISLYALIPGPGGRGRMFLPFMADQFQDVTGQVNAAGKALMDAIRDQWIGTKLHTNPAGGSLTMASVLWKATLSQWWILQQGVSRTKFGTMRSRGDYGAK